MVKVILKQKDTSRGDPHDRRSHSDVDVLRRPDPEHQAPGNEVLQDIMAPRAAPSQQIVYRVTPSGHKSRLLKPGNFVEVCCGANSRLSAAADGLRCSEAFRVTEEDDFLNENTLQECIARVRGPDDMVWFSIPCTGGSRWQIVHLHRGGQAAVDRVNQHIALMRRLWNQAKKLITHAHNVGASWVV